MNPVAFRTIQIDGLSIFYREAGAKNAETLLLLHGLPSSSRMFEPLFARLSARYHLIAPDYPGFGHSDWPDPQKFAYTFDHFAEIMDHFTEALRISRYTLYLQDYGGPVGFRMALAHPERVGALIVQDAVAHNEGLGENWKTRRAFWADRRGRSRFKQTACDLSQTQWINLYRHTLAVKSISNSLWGASHSGSKSLCLSVQPVAPIVFPRQPASVTTTILRMLLSQSDARTSKLLKLTPK